MIDQDKARALAREGFDLWQAGDFVVAAEKYALANELADPNHWARHAYYGEYACVLEKLGRIEDAIEQMRLAVKSAVDQHGYTDQIAQTECCFYAELLVGNGQSKLAVEVLEPFLEARTEESWHLLLVASRAYLAVDHRPYARALALECLEAAPSQEKRDELHEMLADALNGATKP
jgi:tetratricopeptide (TPR) repeat protein